MPLTVVREPFSDPRWIFEIKWDGFRSLVHIECSPCRLVSRNGNDFKSFPALTEALPAELRCRSAVLDGEIVSLDRHGPAASPPLPTPLQAWGSSSSGPMHKANSTPAIGRHAATV